VTDTQKPRYTPKAQMPRKFFEGREYLLVEDDGARGLATPGLVAEDGGPHPWVYVVYLLQDLPEGEDFLVIQGDDVVRYADVVGRTSDITDPVAVAA
jgi:hypothetical protein